MDTQQEQLRWLGEQHFEEGRHLREAEENLFNWATTIYLAAMGALASLRGNGMPALTPAWRFYLWLGIAAITLVIVLMAYFSRKRYEQNAQALGMILDQLASQGEQPGYAARWNILPSSTDRMIFTLRWAGIAVVAFILMALVSLL